MLLPRSGCFGEHQGTCFLVVDVVVVDTSLPLMKFGSGTSKTTKNKNPHVRFGFVNLVLAFDINIAYNLEKLERPNLHNSGWEHISTARMYM